MSTSMCHQKIRILLYLLCSLVPVITQAAGNELPATVIKVPARWQQQGYVIHLKDELQHPGINWPVTLLRYHLDFGAHGPVGNNLSVVDAQSNQPVPFQWAPVKTQAGVVQQATLYLLTDLPSGSHKSFKLLPQAVPLPSFPHQVSLQQEKGQIILSNGLVRVAVPSPNATTPQAPIVRYGDSAQWLGKGEWPANLRNAVMKVEPVETGPLSTAYRINYTFEHSRSYIVLVRLTAAMEFAVLEEQMKGFTAIDSLSWQLVWNGLQPGIRYIPTRNGIVSKDNATDYYSGFLREPMEGYPDSLLTDKHPYQRIDQQNSATGKLPFQLAVYDNWMSWWRLPTAAFWQEEEQATTIGLFVKEAEQWNDEQYPLWGSKEALGIAYHWKNKILDYSFPLVQGSRSTALAAYPHGKDKALMNATKKPLAYIDYLRRYYGWVSLDKTKDWVLNYEAPDEQPATYFKSGLTAGKLPLSWLEQNLYNMVASVATGSERNASPTPVGSRIFYESIAPAFAINKANMTAAQYKKLRAWFLFMGYVCMDEGLMPIRTMLSGHPNFLMDIKSVPGLCAYLFPAHPQAPEMAAHFEKAIQLNYNYHIRPPVQSWEAQGGRWTENLATYTWAALRPALRTVFLLHRYYDGRNRILQPGVSDLGNWLLNALTPPLDLAGGRRSYSPQGAHAHAFKEGPPDLLRILAQQLTYYDPLLAEHLFWATSATDKPFEGERERTPVWKEILEGEWAHNQGTAPSLSSTKYTGYGVVLRSAMGASNEMQVLLQQIDEGPNYRWGRAAQGGNGVIYYYAGGKRYSFNGPEDVGDGPFGDVERCTNFGILQPPGYRDIGPYRSIGRGDLTAPLYDFGFAQSATIQGKNIAYRSRSIMQSGADYIVIFDDVATDTTTGRFSWFTGREDDFPFIHQVKPGISPIDAAIQPGQSNYHKDSAVLPAKGRYYDGRGDFLTIVTHRPALKVATTSYGCTVQFPNNDKDHIFRSDKTILFHEGNTGFNGKAGFIKQQATGNKVAAALFEGKELQAGGLHIVLNTSQPAGISFQSIPSGYKGKYKSNTAQQVRFRWEQPGTPAPVFYMDGIPVKTMPGDNGSIYILFKAGEHDWQWSANGLIPGKPQITGTVNSSQSCTVQWAAVPGATAYQVQLSKDNGARWQPVTPEIKDTQAVIKELVNDTKVHLRVIAKAAGGWGPASAAYPVYVAAGAPHHPEGLQVSIQDKTTQLTWGQVLGTAHYKLYRRIKGAGDTNWQLVYKGKERQYADRINHSGPLFEYAVTAVNGNGESKKSTAVNTDPASILNWYPTPRSKFRRDTESHENGFPEFNPFLEDTMRVITYPSK